MTPTNLTDEGLRREAQWICDCKKHFKKCVVCQKIASALQKVRDLTRSETIEACAKIVDDNIWTANARQDIAEAIRKRKE